MNGRNPREILPRVSAESVSRSSAHLSVSNIRFPPARGLVPLGMLLLAWELLADSDSPFFPPPSDWLSALGDLLESGKLVAGIGATLHLFLLSLAVGVVVGTALGFLMGWSRKADAALGGIVEFIRAIPSAAVVPLVVLILGATQVAYVAVIVTGTMWPVVLAAREALKRMNPLLHDVSRTLRLNARRESISITLPSLVPDLLIGVKVMAPMTLIVTLLVEMITGRFGIGELLIAAQNRFNAEQVYGMVLVTAAIALAVAAGVELLEASLARFRRH